jgi:tetratricopeptide (TPR) repeat protein
LEYIPELEHLISHGRYLEARHHAEQYTGEPGKKFRQLYGLALTKTGLAEEAVRDLEALYQVEDNDPETAGILASAYKELFKQKQQTSFAVRSRDTYLKNFSATRNPYTGINAASMSAMLMQGSKSKEIAREIIALIPHDTQDTWEAATLGEAYLLIKESQNAIQYYQRARRLCGKDWGKVGSVYNQLWLLNHYLPVNKEVLRMFAPPGVVAFAGHMVDQPTRREARFPNEIQHRVKEAIKNQLQNISAHVGYCSIACGSDILFAEAMEELDGEVNIFLPFDKTDFLEVSVAFAGEEWVQRFHRLCERHRVIQVTSERYSRLDALFNFQSRVIIGSALLRSKLGQNQCTLMTVFSKTDLKFREGGTRDTITSWPTEQSHVNINPDDFVANFRTQGTASSAPPLINATGEAQKRKVLFVMVINLKGMEAMKRDRLRKECASLPSEFPEGVVYNPVGADHLFMAFESEFAVYQLVDKINDINATLSSDRRASAIIDFYVDRLDSPSLAENAMLKLAKIPLNGISATGSIAALLALHPQKYLLTFSGSMTFDDDSETVAFYQVQKSGLKN